METGRHQMSFRLVADVFELDLPAGHKLVLAVLASHANEEGLCYPSISRIAWMTGQSERSTQRALQNLRESGVVEVAQRATRYTPTLYRIHPSRGAKLAPLEEVRGAKNDTAGVTPVTSRGDTVAPESVIEPVIEPKSAETARPPKSEPWYLHVDVPNRNWAPETKPWTWSTPTGTVDQLFDAVIEVCRVQRTDMTRTYHAYASKFIEELRMANASPGEVKQRARRYSRLFAGCELTPAALGKWWPRLTEVEEQQVQGHRCPPHRWVDMDDDQRGRYCVACKQWEQTA